MTRKYNNMVELVLSSINRYGEFDISIIISILTLSNLLGIVNYLTNQKQSLNIPVTEYNTPGFENLHIQEEKKKNQRREISNKNEEIKKDTTSKKGDKAETCSENSGASNKLIDIDKVKKSAERKREEKIKRYTESPLIWNFPPK
jgi:hypothetical protein